MLLQMALFHSYYYWIILHYIDMCMYHIFIHSYVNEHICCFHVLAIINRAAMSIEVHISFWTMFFSRYMHVLCLVAQLCPTVCDSMDCSPPGSSVHGIFQARILEQVAMSYSRTMKYYPATKKNEIMPSAATWRHIEIIMTAEVWQTNINIVW